MKVKGRKTSRKNYGNAMLHIMVYVNCMCIVYYAKCKLVKLYENTFVKHNEHKPLF